LDKADQNYQLNMVQAEIDCTPSSVLQFTLTRGGTASNDSSSAPNVVMTLGNKQDFPVAFKVKTTQPRRYLVRPNQGILKPDESISVTILLVDKDQQALLQNYDKLGFSQEALDAATKDKFLVQSCAIMPEYSTLEEAGSNVALGKEQAEKLTAMWNHVGNKANNWPCVNKKLLVKHLVVNASPSDGTADTANSDSVAAIVAAAAATGSSSATKSNMAAEDMSTENLVEEVTRLRKKYDELIQFSVNLTAERDILNNSLEQTRRELQMTKMRSNSGSASAGTDSATRSAKGFKLWTLVLVGIIMFALGRNLPMGGAAIQEAEEL